MSWTTTGSQGRIAPTARREMDRLRDQFDERLIILIASPRKKNFFFSRGIRGRLAGSGRAPGTKFVRQAG
jgi:hypothetical protein